MARWIFGGLIAVVLVGGLAASGFYRYVMTHANEPESYSARIYERAMKDKLFAFCTDTAQRSLEIGEVNTQAQVDSACKCFSNDMFEKLRNVPPDELDAMLQKTETSKSAENIAKKCGYQAGLN